MRLTRSTAWMLFPASLLIAALSTGCHHAAPEADAGGDKPPQATVPIQVATVETGTIESVATASGVIQPLPDKESAVNPGTAGKVTSVLVRPGDHVRRGQPLVLLDSTRLQGLLRQAESAVASARAQEAQAALEILSQEQTYRSNVRQAESAVRSAQLTLDRLLAGARPQEIGQSKAAVTQAEASLNNAKATRDRVQYLFQRGIAAKKEVLDADTQYMVAESQVNNARQALSLVEAGARPQDVEEARVQVKQSQNALKQARAGVVDTRAKEEALHSLQQQVRGDEAVASVARNDLNLATVHAPISGNVVQRSVTRGASVDTTTVLLNLADLSEVEFLAQLQPQDLRRVHTGQTATLSVSSYPNHTWVGRIIQIATATDPKTNTVPARVRLLNPGGLLKDNMYGTVRFRLAKERSLLVPKSSVLSDEQGHYVFVVDSKEFAHRKKVTVGLTDSNRVEILKGLTSGDRIVITGNYGLTDGVKVSIQP